MARQMMFSFEKLYFWHALCYDFSGLMPQNRLITIKNSTNYGKDYWN